jgi:hypothetical protein
LYVARFFERLFDSVVSSSGSIFALCFPLEFPGIGSHRSGSSTGLRAGEKGNREKKNKKGGKKTCSGTRAEAGFGHSPERSGGEERLEDP